MTIRCKVFGHQWRIKQRSNIIQFDNMGYPLRLFICECKYCKKSEQMWIDSTECKNDVVLQWSDKEMEDKEKMSDIDLVIKIPAEMYQAIKESSTYISGRRNGKTIDHTLFNAVKKGTPLPEHYGKLIDVDQINTLDIFVLNEYGGQFIRKSDIDNIQPIIDAESEGI